MQPVRRTDILTTFSCQLSRNLGASTSRNLKACTEITVLLLISSRQLSIYYFITNHDRLSRWLCGLRHGPAAAQLWGLGFESH